MWMGAPAQRSKEFFADRMFDRMRGTGSFWWGMQAGPSAGLASRRTIRDQQRAYRDANVRIPSH
jgi:hypothetical protein